MFAEILKLIDDKEYDAAITKLHPISHSDNTEEAAKATYLLGYINTRWDNKKKNSELAKRYLLSNLNGEYPQPLAYVLYAGEMEDTNIAINYLKMGIRRFPKQPKIYEELLRLSVDKDSLVDEIQKQGFDDISLLGKVISYLISSGQWEKINRFTFRIRNGNELDVEENMYLILIEAYACLFRKDPDYKTAQEYFKKVLTWDTNNLYAYAHYIGLIYAYIKEGNQEKAIEYFDRLPISNSIYDFDDGPYPMGIYIVFEQMYGTIFGEITKLFVKDTTRKNKARVIYALYLYYPSESFDIFRYKKADALLLSNFLKTEFNAKVGVALYNMRCHFKQFKGAYEVLWDFLRNYADLEMAGVFFSEISSNVPLSTLVEIAEYTVMCLRKDIFDREAFEKHIFSDLIECLDSKQLYGQICSIAQYVSVAVILESDCAFACALAYGKEDHERATEIYKGIIKNNTANSAAINNLGVQYEHKEKFYDALICYDKAVTLCPAKQLYKNNQKRMYDRIQQIMEENISQISDTISTDALEGIGYTIDFCKVVYFVKDESMRDILLRDLRECAIAIVIGQDKLASIMCGSIIEALLMQKMNECGITKYDISQINKRSNAANSPISEMGLNELLYVANKERLISDNSYHLGHYVRDYRNIVHPAKEKRMKEEIDHENVLTMWSVLKRLINELFCERA